MLHTEKKKSVAAQRFKKQVHPPHLSTQEGNRLASREELLALHERLTREARALMERKNKDYGGASEVFRNFDASTAVGVHPVQGVLLRTLDKLSRIRTHAEGQTLQTDSLEDSFVDVINYMVLAAGLCGVRAENGQEGA